MKSVVWLLDSGHGSTDPLNCQPVTPGKRSPVFPKGSVFEGQTLIEGTRNRAVMNYLIALMRENGHEYRIICDTWKDCSLSSRTNKANEIIRSNIDPNVEFVYLSIHHNAFKSDWNTANGVSTHVYPGSKLGKEYGEIFQKEIVESTEMKSRGIRESNFYVLRKTICPAVLTENGFMTNLKDASFAMSEGGSQKIAAGHFAAIKKIENEIKK
tara:strand:+ start:24713 stop:25348 length:636 start_codon:yes stop_codon:yes gene_type:complete